MSCVAQLAGHAPIHRILLAIIALLVAGGLPGAVSSDQPAPPLVVVLACEGDASLTGAAELVVTDVATGREHRRLIGCGAASRPTVEAEFPNPPADVTWQARVTARTLSHNQTCDGTGSARDIVVVCDVDGGSVVLRAQTGGIATPAAMSTPASDRLTTRSITVSFGCQGPASLRGTARLVITDESGKERRLFLSCDAARETTPETTLPILRGGVTWSVSLAVSAASGERDCEETGSGLPIAVRCAIADGAVSLQTEGGATAADIPAPEECRATPRDLDELLALGTVPLPEQATPFAGLPVIEAGEPAGDEVIAGVTATMREALACFNAGDYLRAFALYTNDYFRRLFATNPYDGQATELFSAPAVPRLEAERLALLAVQDARTLPDGRVVAVVMLDDPMAPGPETPSMVWFAEVDGTWRIDEVVPLPADR